MLYGGDDAVGHKQALPEICPQQDATQFAGTEHRQFFVGKFRRHEKRIPHASRLQLDEVASSLRDESPPIGGPEARATLKTHLHATVRRAAERGETENLRVMLVR